MHRPGLLTGVAQRLDRKGGQEVGASCPDRDDAQGAAGCLVDRSPRLAPTRLVTAAVGPCGGQLMIALTTTRRR